MNQPRMYINVSQTIFAVLAAGLVGSYILNREFRLDANDLFRSLIGRG